MPKMVTPCVSRWLQRPNRSVNAAGIIAATSAQTRTTRPSAAAARTICLATAKNANMPERDSRLQAAGVEQRGQGSPGLIVAHPPVSRRPFLGWLLVALLLIAIDQLTKIWFDTEMMYGERWNILPFFDFTL